MGALPKQRTSHARQGERRAHHHLRIPQLVACPQCKRPRLSHHACPSVVARDSCLEARSSRNMHCRIWYTEA